MADANTIEKRDEGEGVELQVPRGAFRRSGGIAVRNEVQARVHGSNLSRQNVYRSRARQVAPNRSNVAQLMPAHELLEARRRVIDRDDLPVARRSQEDVMSDETRSAGHEHAHENQARLAPYSAYQGIVREMPDSSETFG